MGCLLFFDGDCALCSASVRLIRRLDRRRRIEFEPLQGELAQQLGLTQYAANDGTLVLLRQADGQVTLRSDALIELARALGGIWRLWTLARFIPKPLREWGYRRVAANRHRLMKSATCPVDLKRP